MILLLAVLLAAPIPPYAQERQLLDRRLEALRRILPDAPQPAADAAHLSEVARAAGAGGLTFQARPPMETGTRGDVLIDVNGAVGFLDVDRFFRQAALSPRLVDVERLTMRAARGGAVQVNALLRLPYRPPGAPLPRPPEGLPPVPPGTSRAEADLFLRDQALALAKVQEIARLKRDRRNPRLFLAEIASIVRDRPALIQEATFGDEIAVRGFALGDGTMRALEARASRGFFRVTDVLMTRNAACHQFEIRGRVPIVGPDAEIPAARDDPFRHEEDPCVVHRDPGRRIVVQQPRTKGAPMARGPFTVRTRGLDAADVFQVLNTVTGDGFLVDPDVAGRVDLDFSRVPLPDILAGMARAGVHAFDLGPFRRVSRSPGNTTELATPVPAGAPLVTLVLKRADLRDVFEVLTSADPAATPVALSTDAARLSIWVREAPVPALRAALLHVVGPAAVEAPGGVGRSAPPRRAPVLRPDEISWSEFTLAALASREGGPWVAFAYTPSGTLQAYRVGDRLADAVVSAVESTDVLLETDDGAVRIPLP